MNILVYFLVCLFFVALFVVGIYNTEDVVVNLIVWRAGPAPLGAVMATASILGIAFACAIGILDGIKIRIANRTLRRQLQRLDEECDALRLQLARHQGRSAPDAEPEKEKARSF